ncbi:type II TA system antitoxin MqsA family protein [Paludisphaera rhizosphaerae]|nr:type II TA system antitoxin MqsA family protein [Paludisphaera rhizosphaerae]
MNCRERQMRRTTIDRYETTVDHDGRSYSLTLKDFEVLQCANCGAIALDDSADDRISAALREAAGLLQPAEIVENRKRLGLTQKQLAYHLRIAESTLSRWETGGQIQQRAMDALLRVFFESPHARSILGASERSEPLQVAVADD